MCLILYCHDTAAVNIVVILKSELGGVTVTENGADR